MCNDYRLLVDVSSIIEEFAELKIKIRFPEGRPNIEAREDIKITDTGPIVRAVDGERKEADLVQRRWSWPSPSKKPVYNFRSEGREFASNRCLIIADGFFEYTAPADPKKKRKDKWLFQKTGESIFVIAGIWRETAEVGEAFTMLTMEPGPDIAPYHNRQIVILERDAWADWLDPSVSAKSLVKPLTIGPIILPQSHGALCASSGVLHADPLPPKKATGHSHHTQMRACAQRAGATGDTVDGALLEA